ncbi:unnamed protein product [Parajaminaea phylloscopi]
MDPLLTIFQGAQDGAAAGLSALAYRAASLVHRWEDPVQSHSSNQSSSVGSQPEAGPSRPRRTHASMSAGVGSSTLANAFSSQPEPQTPSLFNFIRRGEKGELSFRGMSRAEVDQLLWDNRTVCTAGTASLISTAASFPFDSLKSRLQVKYYPSIWSCARAVMREEGLGGFFRGVTIPLITISFVRTSSFGIYVNTKDYLHQRGVLSDKSRLRDVALSGMAGGATSGVIISCGSAPFELVKVQRQLEYLTAVQRGLIGPPSESNSSSGRNNSSKPGSTGGQGSSSQYRSSTGKFKPQSGFQAAANILRQHGGIKGFYIGFPLHFCRDTFGTALYFGSYDSIRSLVNRNSSKKDGSLFGVPSPVVSFLSGSTAGIASWLIVYPVDLLKTNVQQRTLSHHPQQLTGYQLFTHLLRERPPPDNAKRDTVVKRFLRLYRGLGVSALRSFISHGLTWTIIETLSDKIEQRTGRREERRR